MEKPHALCRSSVSFRVDGQSDLGSDEAAVWRKTSCALLPRRLAGDRFRTSTFARRQLGCGRLGHCGSLITTARSRRADQSNRLQCGNRFASPPTAKANEAFALLVEVDAVFVGQQ